LRSLFPYAKLEVTPDLSGIDRVVSLHLINKRVSFGITNPPGNW
jgi:hypothetical protein